MDLQLKGPDPNNVFKTTLLADGDVVSVIVTNASGCMDTHAGITMSVNNQPIANLTVNSSVILPW